MDHILGLDSAAFKGATIIRQLFAWHGNIISKPLCLEVSLLAETAEQHEAMQQMLSKQIHISNKPGEEDDDIAPQPEARY